MVTRSKGDYPDIYDELTRLRREADDGLTPHVMAGSPALCKLLGNGDPFLATGELRDRLSTAAARGDRDILAYYHSLDPGKDATQRLTEAGNKLAVEYRRARDLSDGGALKLAQIIGSDEEWRVPFMGCGLTIRGCDLTVDGYVLVTSGFCNYKHPSFLFDEVVHHFDHRQIREGEWDRHIYGPATFHLKGEFHRVQMRRLGTPKIRVSATIQSDNPAIRVRTSLVLLDYVADVELRRTSAAEAHVV